MSRVVPPCAPRHTETRSLHDGFAWVCGWPVDPEQDGAANHQFRQFLRRGFAGDAGSDGLAAPDHGHPVTDGLHFAQLVGDENDRRAIGLEAAKDDVEILDFLGCQQRGRFVQDQDSAALVEGAQDLDSLLHANRKVAKPSLRVDIEAVRGAISATRRSAASRSSTMIRPLVAEDDVLRDGETGNQHEVLVHHAQTRLDSLARTVELDRIAEDLDLAGVRVIEPEQQVHQGRFPAPFSPRRA